MTLGTTQAGAGGRRGVEEACEEFHGWVSVEEGWSPSSGSMWMLLVSGERDLPSIQFSFIIFIPLTPSKCLSPSLPVLSSSVRPLCLFDCISCCKGTKLTARLNIVLNPACKPVKQSRKATLKHQPTPFIFTCCYWILFFMHCLLTFSF